MPSPWQARAPFEILSNIFLLCLPDDDAPLKIQPGNIPLVLTMICGLWRNVALNTPRLWSRLEIMFTSDPTLRALNRTWLFLSSPLPMTLRAQSDTRSTCSVSSEVEIEYIAALCVHAARWKSVRLCLSNMEALHVLASSFSPLGIAKASPLPVLEHLELNAPVLDNGLATLTDDQSIYDPPLLDAISACPTLTSLHVKFWRPIMSFHENYLPPTLLNLELFNSTQEPFHLDIFVSSLSRCTGIASLTLWMPNVLGGDEGVSRV